MEIPESEKINLFKIKSLDISSRKTHTIEYFPIKDSKYVYLLKETLEALIEMLNIQAEIIVERETYMQKEVYPLLEELYIIKFEEIANRLREGEINNKKAKILEDKFKKDIKNIKNKRGLFIKDDESRLCIINGERINFTKREYQVFVMLVRNENCNVDRETINNNIWGSYYKSKENKNVDLYIYRVRRKLGKYKYLVEGKKGSGYMYYTEKLKNFSTIIYG